MTAEKTNYPEIQTNTPPVVQAVPPPYQNPPTAQPNAANISYPAMPHPQAPNQAEREALIPRQVVVANTLTPHAQTLYCPRCQRWVQSVTESVSGCCTYLTCWGLLFVGCVPCCLIPFCVDSCKDSVHRCSSCGESLGVYKKL
jgi:lipopolysaccharide-induced tumor necrosis factor-alpha factor